MAKKIRMNVVDNMDDVTDELEVLNVVVAGGWKNCDMFTECKSWKTAIRRFQKALENEFPEIAEWCETLRESCEMGSFHDSPVYNDRPSENSWYAWEVEESGDGWYIFLNVKDELEEFVRENNEKVQEHENMESKTEKQHDENWQYCKDIALQLDEIVGGRAHNEDGEPIDLGDWMNDEVLDITYLIASDGSYEHCKLYVTLGGPTVWVDTHEREVKLSWGSEKASYPLLWETRDCIDEWVSEIWNSMRG